MHEKLPLYSVHPNYKGSEESKESKATLKIHIIRNLDLYCLDKILGYSCEILNGSCVAQRTFTHIFVLALRMFLVGEIADLLNDMPKFLSILESIRAYFNKFSLYDPSIQ